MGKKSLAKQALVLFLTTSILSCSNKSSRYTGIINSLQPGMEESINHLNISSAIYLKDLKDKTTRPETAERAGKWFSKANRIHDLSSDLKKHIDHLNKSKDITVDSCTSLYNHIKKYITEILNIDPEIDSSLINEGVFPASSAFESSKDANDFYNKYFKDLDKVMITAVLTSTQNDLANAENKTISYCRTKIGMVDGEGYYCSTFSAVVSQNSKIFKPGDDLEIFAGMGAFTKIAQPEISFNNVQVPLDAGGVAIFRRPITEKPGNYSIPVSIRYLNQVTGFYETKEINVEYTVTQPCNQ